MSTSPSLLQILTRSEYRKDILFLVEERARSQSEINDYFHVTSPEIQPRLKEMEAANLIIKNEGTYQLTLFGKILAKYYKPFLDTITAIESNGDFWESHDLSAIPEDLFFRIHELKDCKVVEAENSNLFESHKEFVENVSKSTRFMGAACVFIPSWTELFLNLAIKGIKIEIIVTEGIFNKLKSEYPQELKTLLENNTRMYLCKTKLSTTFATTDRYFSLALTTTNGTFYDHKNDLMGCGETAVKWGESLFEYYKEQSVEVKLTD